jgi:hypothetical protein
MDNQNQLLPVIYDDENGNPQIGWASEGLNNHLRRRAGMEPQYANAENETSDARKLSDRSN